MAGRPAPTPDGFVCLCVIGAAHGVRGAVKVKCFAENPQDLLAYGPLQNAEGQGFTVTSVKPDKLGARISLKGVSDRDAAAALRGTALFLAREKLPALDADDDFYHADLVGLAARGADGENLGAVVALHNFVTGDLLEIEPPKPDNGGKTPATVFYPFTRAVVPHIDIAAGHLTLLPPSEDEARPPDPLAEGDDTA